MRCIRRVGSSLLTPSFLLARGCSGRGVMSPEYAGYDECTPLNNEERNVGVDVARVHALQADRRASLDCGLWIVNRLLIVLPCVHVSRRLHPLPPFAVWTKAAAARCVDGRLSSLSRVDRVSSLRIPGFVTRMDVVAVVPLDASPQRRDSFLFTMLSALVQELCGLWFDEYAPSILVTVWTELLRHDDMKGLSLSTGSMDQADRF